MKLLNAVMAATVLLLSTSLSAQTENRQTIVVEGTEIIDQYEINSYYPGAATYKIFLEVDTQATLISSNATGKSYSEAVTGFDIKFYDQAGAEISGPDMSIEETEFSTKPMLNFIQTAESDVIYTNSIYGQGFSHTNIYISGDRGSLINSLDGFPSVVTGATSAWLNYFHMSDSRNGYVHFDPEGQIDAIGYLIADADNDGYADDIDLCPASATEETVWFDGWYDSSVTNVVDADGCTVMDHYAACSVEEEQQQTFFSRRSLFSGPSYCEKQVAYGLVTDGTIDYRTARDLRDALYYSAQNGGRR